MTTTTTKRVAMALAALLLAGCSPGFRDNQQVPNPAPDHGAEIQSLEDCIKPWLLVDAAVLPGGETVLPPGELYARRQLHIVIIGTDIRGNPLEIADYNDPQTGHRFEWTRHPYTDAEKPYRVCVEYLAGTWNYFMVTITAEVQAYDWFRMEVSTDKRMDMNICANFGGDDSGGVTGLDEYNQIEVEPGETIVTLSCLVTVV